MMVPAVICMLLLIVWLTFLINKMTVTSAWELPTPAGSMSYTQNNIRVYIIYARLVQWRSQDFWKGRAQQGGLPPPPQGLGVLLDYSAIWAVFIVILVQ